MNRLSKRRLKRAERRKYCGYDYHQMAELMERLCVLEDDVVLTDCEQEAMDIAIQAMCTIHNAMVTGRKDIFDG